MQAQQGHLEALQFFLQRAAVTEILVGFAVPVFGILQITLLNVDDAVQPGTRWRVVDLHEVVSFGPAPRKQMVQNLAESAH